METLIQIAKRIQSLNGKAFKIGGCVRDKFLNLESKDIDVEVFGLDVDVLISILKDFGRVDVVGKSFGVIKLTAKDQDFDFSLPRRENKISVGHTGFEVTPDKNMTIEEAALRRDFTINAISENILTGEIIDPFGGIKDLENRVLVPISEKFKEDPLRVLRGFQFAGRFGMTASPLFIEFAKELKNEFNSLSKERIWVEWEKWAAKSTKPSMGLKVLKETGWLKFFPEISALVGIPQEAEWHPEGDVFVHTCHVCDAGVEISDREGLDREKRVNLILGGLCHDLGKAVTTFFGEDGRWKSPKHDIKGEPIARTFLKSIKAPNKVVDRVCELTLLHMFHVSLKEPVSMRTVKRLMLRMKHNSVEMLRNVIEADASGRPPLPKGLPPLIDVVVEMSKNIKEECSLVPLVNGGDLMKLGFKSGVELGTVKNHLFELQIEGEDCKETLLEIARGMLV